MTKPKPIKKDPKARKRRKNVHVADWGGAEHALIVKLIEAVTQDNGAIRFGYSRDGGAYSLGIYGDGKPFSEFLPGNQDVDDWIREIIDDYE